MCKKKGTIQLEVAGLDKVVSAGAKMSDIFGGVGNVISNVRQTMGLLSDTADRLFRVLQGAGSDEAIRETFRVLGGDIETLRRATRGLVSDTDLQRASNRALSLGLEVTQERYGTLLDAAIRVGRATGSTAVQSIDALSRSLQHGTVRGLRAIGVLVDYEKIQYEVARDLGITTTEMTAQQKQAVLLETAERALAHMTERLHGVQTPLADSSDRISATFGNLESRINQMLATTPGFEASLERIADSIFKLSTAAARALVELSPLLELIASNPVLGLAIGGGLAGAVVGGPTGALVGFVGGGITGMLGEGAGEPPRLGDTRRLAEAQASLINAGGSRADAQLRRYAAELEAQAWRISSSEGRP